jgi:hypothetical protein
MENYARPRVIRGTRAKPLPLLPSGSGGVHSRPLHEARSLTTTHANTGHSLDVIGDQWTVTGSSTVLRSREGRAGFVG